MSQSRSTEILEQALAPLVLLSTATKPTNAGGVNRIRAGQTLLEYDTGNVFTYTADDDWVLTSGPGLITSLTTVDLNQAIGDYDLFELGDVGIEIVGLTIVIPADLTGTAAGALTAISIQSTDTVPVVFISNTAGAKANLTKDKHLTYFGNAAVAPTKKIQLSIEGGATTAEQIGKVFIAYRAGGV